MNEIQNSKGNNEMDEIGHKVYINEYPTIDELKAMLGLRPDQSFSEIEVDDEEELDECVCEDEDN